MPDGAAMSVLSGKAEDICSSGAFQLLTLSGSGAGRMRSISSWQTRDEGIVLFPGIPSPRMSPNRTKRSHVHCGLCFRKLGSICIDGGVALLMNTGRSVCDLNRHTLSLFNTHSLIKSATIGGFDWRFDGPP